MIPLGNKHYMGRIDKSNLKLCLCMCSSSSIIIKHIEGLVQEMGFDRIVTDKPFLQEASRH